MMNRKGTRAVLAALALASTGCQDPAPQDSRSAASAHRWATAESQFDMNAAAAADLDDSEAELATVLGDVRKLASRNGVPADAALRLLEASQSAWESYVEAQIAMEWPKGDGHWHGSVAPMCIAQRRAMLINARVRELREVLAAEDGDVCGSRWP